MKIIKFRDVLWTVANKLGLDPEQGNFLSNQAIPLGRYIDQWVRRTYDASDWPELVVVEKFAPDLSHNIPYQGQNFAYPDDVGHQYKLGRILKVYLVDPRTTSAPVSTDFSLLFSGVHVGFEHGSTVWIRYLWPAPRYTAEVWDPNRSYAQDEITYSPASGECYRSLVNSNRNHDPQHSYRFPPLPPDVPPPQIESGTPPNVVVFQDYIASDPGQIGQTQINIISVVRLMPPEPILPDPVVNGTFTIEVSDVNLTPIGSASHTAVNHSWATIVADLASQLDASLPGTFIVTPGLVPTITLEDLSNYKITKAWYAPGTGGVGTAVKRYMQVFQQQVYLEPRPAVEGQVQATYVQVTNESLIPGALYRLTMVDGNGIPHPVNYQSNSTDGIPQIIQGLAAAIGASTDTFWEGVTRDARPGQGILFLFINDNASTNAKIILIGDAYWEWNAFPQVLAEQVIRGALADLYREWGQNDKAAAEEGVVPQEAQLSSARFTSTPNPPLSGQNSPVSRYKL